MAIKFQVFARHGAVVFKEIGEQKCEYAIGMQRIRTVLPDPNWTFSSHATQEMFKQVGKSRCLEITIEGVIEILETFESCFYAYYEKELKRSVYWFYGNGAKAIYDFYFGDENGQTHKN